MTGERRTSALPDATARAPAGDAPVALEVRDLAGEDFHGISFSVRRGEVLGIAGATSSGRIGVAEAVAGLGDYSGGTITGRTPGRCARATCRRRSRSASAACRKAGTSRASC